MNLSNGTHQEKLSTPQNIGKSTLSVGLRTELTTTKNNSRNSKTGNYQMQNGNQVMHQAHQSLIGLHNTPKSIGSHTNLSRIKPANSQLQPIDIPSLWMRMSALFGRSFTSQFGEHVDKAGVWTMTLSMLTQNDIDYGFKKIMLSDNYKIFPPTPKQFKDECLSRYAKFQLPKLKDAFLEARNFFNSTTHIWTHHAVKYCAHSIGEQELLNANEAKAWNTFKAHYEAIKLKINNGICLPKIEQNATKYISKKEIGTKAISQIKKILQG
jgi:hypothetical protein